MATNDFENTVSFDPDPTTTTTKSTLDTAMGKGKEYVDATVAAAQEKPWTAAAIGAGVAATVAAAAYGATKLAQQRTDAPKKTAKKTDKS